MTGAPPHPALEVRDLGVVAGSGSGARTLLHAVNFTLAPGSSVGLVGPSGAGKSTAGRAIMRLLPRGLHTTPTSSVRLGPDALLDLPDAAMRSVRGRRLAMVFQEPLRALDPAMTVGDQLAESAVVHAVADRREATERAVAMLARVGIADPHEAARRHPHEFSGGMRQRVLIAMALLLGPEVLIADEPTTSLDATVQAQMLDLLDALRAESGTALVLISHDLDVVGERCERVLVLEDGRLVADGPAREIVRARRPALRVATRAPHGSGPANVHHDAPPDSLLELRAFTVHHRARRGPGVRRARVVRAVQEVDLDIARGEAVGLVGESGCGKSSLAQAVLRLADITAGTATFAGTDLAVLRGEPLRRMRSRIQLVPQDAGASLTPHLTAESLVAEGLEVHGLAHGAAARATARALLAETGLPARAAAAYPHELSAGERQRVAIARALGPGPELLVCDEPVASVDAPTRERLLELLDRLRRERSLALLFISHDLAAVSRVTSRVLVMYLGRIIESAPTDVALAAPLHPYTRALLSAVPTGDPAARARRTVLAGEPPSPLDPPAGCAFHPRCPHLARDAQCARERPELTSRGHGHRTACWHQ
jgi:peptide/nickel transport system ATP-binding protein